MALETTRPAESVGQHPVTRSDTAGSNIAEKTGPHVVCTTAEGSYFYGLAALANSLVQAGFKGSIVVGYRHGKPTWLATLERDPQSDAHLVTPEVRLQLVEVPGTWHLANYKGHLMHQIFHEIVPDAELVYFFDTDICIDRSWETFAAWAHHGVVVALDMADSYMSPHHVYRRAWRALAKRANRDCRDFTGYVNSGCVGINRRYAEFAEVWGLLMEQLEKDGADMRRMKNWTGPLEFSRMDQDVLNATIMATDTPIAVLGFEAMGLFPWANTVMPHAMFHRKPWARNYIVDALRGFPPNHIYRNYWKFADGPIRPFGEFELKRKRTAVAIARLIGLLRTRSYRDL